MLGHGRSTLRRDVQRLTDYWRNGFDWRKAESKLNQLPHSATHIRCDGFENLGNHFFDKRSTSKGAIPLLFVHGWPGNFFEATKLLEPLTKGREGQSSFHAIAPSLPNYGFSEGTRRRGFAIEQYADTCHKLMQQVGYKEYVTQAGDWGYYITRTISLLYPDSCKATRLNMDVGLPPQWTKNPLFALQHMIIPYTAREKHGISRSKWFDDEGFGYNLLQGTKPQTLGYGLTDSPVALLSWIYEKLHDWTDN